MRFVFTFNCVLVCFLIISSSAKSQSIQDPLKKPRVWAMIMEAPESRVSWVKYVGKPWSTMTDNEKRQIEVWKEKMNIIISESENGAVVGGNVTNSDDNDAFAGFENSSAAKAHAAVVEQEEMTEAAFFASYEKAVIAEPELLVGLKRNIIANFIIIDDTYREEFEAMGIAYQTYDEAHPEGKYNKETWVVEKEKELVALKKQQLEELKKSMNSSDEK